MTSTRRGFHQTNTSDAFWDRDQNISDFGVRGQVQGHGGIKCWKQQLGTQQSTSNIEFTVSSISYLRLCCNMLDTH